MNCDVMAIPSEIYMANNETAKRPLLLVKSDKEQVTGANIWKVILTFSTCHG